MDIGDIGIITINRESKAFSGFLGGAFTGAVLGYAVSSGTGIQAEDAVLFALPLGLLGLIGGPFAEIDRTFQIGGTSPEEIKKILIKLRKKSRIPDYQ